MARLPRKLPAELRRLARRARRQGWVIAHARSGHLVWTTPGGVRLFTSATPSDPRTAANFRARLRRHGLTDENPKKK